MTALILLFCGAVVLGVGGRFYSRMIARRIGEDPDRPTPAVERADGVDYVPTPTPVVFAHHFASIAGAGPILGPVIAIVYGWAPAVLWVLVGGLLIGAVHDYLATYMATREGGQSIATIARRMLGRDVFVAMTIFLIIMLALVCAAFLNASATALTSMLPFDRLDLSAGQSLFRVVDSARGRQVVIGGIASMSVVVITATAPLMGWLYLKRKVAVWKCSLLAIGICAAAITIGLLVPMAVPPWAWKFGLSAYVLIAAGVPVWIFLQSRDFINVHILYVGMVGLVVTLLVAGVRGAQVAGGIPAFNVGEGTQALGMIWPGLFIVIACGAVSGFHSLCAGGTTSKQLNSEPAARRIGYNAMLLESFLAVCVIAALAIGASKLGYLADVHPSLANRLYADALREAGMVTGKPNWVLGFALAVGNAVKLAFGAPVVVGALAGMVLLEGFLVTTLDTAIRLTRYLIEEVWRTFFKGYDLFAAPVAKREPERWRQGDAAPVGAEGIPATRVADDQAPAPAFPTATMGARRWVLRILRAYWFNSALAVGLMLAFALTGGQQALWKIFATSNQLLAAMGLALAALWLLRRRRQYWFTVAPALFMLVTTGTNLVLLLRQFVGGISSALAEGRSIPSGDVTLLIADVVIMAITVYLLVAGVRAVLRHRRARYADPDASAD